MVVATYSSPAVGGTAGACRDYDNVARVDESDTDDFDTSGSTVEVCVDLDDLVVTKTAKPAFARDYDWTIEKSVKGASSQTVDEGTPASFGYDVVVTPSISGDGQFVVTGVISVQNPNQTTISGVQLTDSLPAATCTIDKPAGAVSIPKGTSTFDYSCVLPGRDGEHERHQHGDGVVGQGRVLGTSGSASGQAGFDFADAKLTVTDATATVTDTQVDLDGTSPDGVVVRAVDGPRTFTYTKAFDGVPGACTTYDNTAKVVADGLEGVGQRHRDGGGLRRPRRPGGDQDGEAGVRAGLRLDDREVGEGRLVADGAAGHARLVRLRRGRDPVRREGHGVRGLRRDLGREPQPDDHLRGAADRLAARRPVHDRQARGAAVDREGDVDVRLLVRAAGATPTTTGTNTATASWDKAAYHGTSGSASGTQASTSRRRRWSSPTRRRP